MGIPCFFSHFSISDTLYTWPLNPFIYVTAYPEKNTQWYCYPSWANMLETFYNCLPCYDWDTDIKINSTVDWVKYILERFYTQILIYFHITYKFADIGEKKRNLESREDTEEPDVLKMKLQWFRWKQQDHQCSQKNFLHSEVFRMLADLEGETECQHQRNSPTSFFAPICLSFSIRWLSFTEH